MIDSILRVLVLTFSFLGVGYGLLSFILLEDTLIKKVLWSLFTLVCTGIIFLSLWTIRSPALHSLDIGLLGVVGISSILISILGVTLGVILSLKFNKWFGLGILYSFIPWIVGAIINIFHW